MTDCIEDLCFLLSGVSWVDMHKLANKVMLQGMLEYGLLKGDINDMMEVRCIIVGG